MSQSTVCSQRDAAIGSKANDPGSIQWIGMSPLELIETLAAETEKREANAGIFVQPIRINDIVLSYKAPPAPVNGNERIEPKNDFVISSKAPPAAVNGNERIEPKNNFVLSSKAPPAPVNDKERIEPKNDFALSSKAPPAPVKGIEPNNDLTEYMTRWLKENWTNPYPDEDCFECMAIAYGTTQTVVRNWLTNVRTRRWRPAIIKAYELDKHPRFLLEDSLAIFDGKPVGKKVDHMEDAAAIDPQQVPASKRTKFNLNMM